ncbi:MAG TPA: hypothetical protein VFQ61_10025, partial [Polyangiaceae bacterium]|nr:hypothetical protein [Polyangiaceae bacterium]
ALSGRIARISSDLASPYELREAFGEGAQLPSPSYRVEMSVVDDDNLRRLSPRIRPGMLVTARFTLRRRTLVALVLDPLRRWLR